LHTQVAQILILAITVAVLIGIVWFGYRSHLKEQQRASEEYAQQLERQRRFESYQSQLRQAKTRPEPSRPAPTVRATDTGSMTDPLNPLSPFSPLNPLNQHSVSDHHECTSRNHRHDPTPSFSSSDSGYSGSSSSDSSSSSSSSSSSCD
jgi:hypothetical protein